MDRQVFYPLLPEIRKDFGFTLEQSGLLATGFTIGPAVAGSLDGFVVDRYARKTVIIGSVLVYSLAPLAGPLAVGFFDMAAYRIISGVGEGVQATALYALVGSFFFHRRALLPVSLALPLAPVSSLVPWSVCPSPPPSKTGGLLSSSSEEAGS
ncbi:MFS transporter [Arthrobacter sp. H16F315]|uniref:MFS transporter n=1 Tax=Arthrobacter sp. H16F315 TaxID=2955314 RepID=UPI002097966F|nr:MFS transporter [Arthrobacter sp. H16F315]MDD1476877.1 MFS transporter [Arthrobacter sp. H16F315]